MATLKGHSHVEQVTDWEDEAGKVAADKAGQQPQNLLDTRPSIGRAAQFLRSSFNASTRFLRLSSITERSVSKPSPRSSSTQVPNSNGTFATLLNGLASAVGLGRDNSPTRDVSPPECSTRTSRGKLVTSQSRTLARLSSAAMMRAEISQYSQFGDLRNDSFTSPAATKLRRRSSLFNRSVDAACIAALAGGANPRASEPGPPPGALFRHSSPGPILTAAPSARPSAPGYFACDAGGSAPVAVAAAFLAAGGGVASPRDVRSAALAGAHHAPPRKAPSAQEAELSAAGSGGAAAGSGQVCVMPHLPSPMHPQPHPQPPPHPRPDGGGGSGGGISPAASRPGSAERLPPMSLMQRQGSSVRDRPPTPRGPRASHTGSPPPSKISKVLGSFRLPDILTGASSAAPVASSKSVTEQRGGAAHVSGGFGGMMASFARSAGGAADGGGARSRRGSASGGSAGGVGLSVRPSGGSFLTAGSSPVLGPGGAAISASVAKRAAAAAAAAASASAPVPVAAIAAVAPHVVPSSNSVTSRGNSGTVRAAGGILQDFQSSLQQDEEGSALAAVDAEFDRRFGRASAAAMPASSGAGAGADAGGGAAGVPGAVDLVAVTRQLREVQQGQGHGQPPPPPQSQSPRPPSVERCSVLPSARRRPIVANASGSGSTLGGGAAAAVGSPETHHHYHQHFQRQSCFAALMTSGGGDGGGGGPERESLLLASFDAPGSPCPGPLNAKMRLASIRLSYADGIVGPCGGAARAPHSGDSLTGGDGGARDGVSRKMSGPQPPVTALPATVGSHRRRSAELYPRPVVAA